MTNINIEKYEDATKELEFRADIIKATEEQAKLQKAISEHNKDRKELLELMHKIEHEIKTMEPYYHWHSVEDRLPENNHKVLFLYVREGWQKNIYMGYRAHGGWNIYLPYDSVCIIPKTESGDIFIVNKNEEGGEITHWTELPEFPEKQGRGWHEVV